MFNNFFFMIPVIKENTRLKVVLHIATGAPITLTKEIIDTPPLVADKNSESLVNIMKSSNVFT